MAIADRINEMYSHVGDVYDTITNVDLPTNKNIQNIPQTIKDSYLEIMNNGIDTIWNNWEKVTGSGTSISLSPTLKAPMKNELKGNTSQTGTPTPTSPIPVNVVSGDNEINVCGKNLFDKTRLISGKRLDNTGLPSITDNAYCTTDYFIKVEPNTTYYSTSTINQSKAVCFYDSGQTFIERKMYLNAHTFTTGATAQFIKISILLSEIDTEQLEKGSTATTYEAYTGNTYNIDLPMGINLYDFMNNTYNNEGNLTITKLSNGFTFTNNSSNFGRIIFSNATVDSSKNYVISFEIDNPNGKLARLGWSGSSKTVETSATSGKITGVLTGITTSAFSIYIDGNSTITITNLMYYEGTDTSKTYEPYGTTPIELCKIGNYQDYFYKDSDKWYLHKEIGKVVLNGSESWGVHGSIASWFYVDNLISGNTLNDSNNSMLSNYFKQEKYSIVTTLTNGQFAYTPSGNKRLVIKDTDYTTVADFKNWLSTHNVTLYYILATPTSTEITDTTLINQLEELYIAKSKENQTNISQINNDLGFIINASALKKG